MNQTAIIIGCHTSNDTKIKSLKYNIARFKELSSKIFVINSQEFRGAIEEQIPGVKVNYMENDSMLCHGKWARMIPKLIKRFDEFILTNDSYTIVNPLDRFHKTYKSARFDHEKNEMVSVIDSREILDQTYWEDDNGPERHYPDFLRWYSRSGIKKWLKHFYEYKDKCETYLDVIRHLEIMSGEIFTACDSAYRVPHDYRGNIHFDSGMMDEWVGHKKYPIVKLKYLSTLETDFYIPEDFNSDEYKTLNGDLVHLNSEEAREHFKNHGLSEGRAYKSSQRPREFPISISKLLPQDII